jgi:hypothetical protein
MIDDSDFFEAFRLQALTSFRGGNIRWFTPEPTFFEMLERFKELDIVDCGTGLGLLPIEAREKGFKMIGIDLAQRDGRRECVLSLDALSYRFNRTCWPMICRPDHSGWCEKVISNALKARAGAFYVGLSKNARDDLGRHYRRHKHLFRNVGKDNESMWVF